MSSIRRSLLLSVLGSNFGVILQLATTAYVARILTPGETGILAVASVFLSLAVSFRDFGVAEYLIQQQNATAEVIRASMAVNLVSSWTMAATLLLAGPWVADFYGAPELMWVLSIQALCLVLIPFGAVTLAWFRREMDARPLLVSQLVSQSTQALVTVVGVAAGAGVFALAWASAAGVLATVVVAWWYRPRWFPRWPSWRGASAVLRFGGHASGVFVANQLGRGAPDLVVGRLEGVSALGMFSRANGVVEMFNRLLMQAVQPVCMPYLAASMRQDGNLAPGLLRATALLTGAGVPCLALLGLGAFPAVRLMYGPQWGEAVPVAQVLCAAAAVELAYRLTEEALFVKGNSRAAHLMILQVQGLRVLGVLVGLGTGHGLIGAALGLLVAALVGAVVSQWNLSRHLGVSPRVMLRAMAPSGVLALGAASPLVLLHLAWPVGESNYVCWGVFSAALGVGAWCLTASASGHPLWTEVRRLVKRDQVAP